jgi:hypothetical protein
VKIAFSLGVSKFIPQDLLIYSFAELVRGMKLADIMAILGSVDIIMVELILSMYGGIDLQRSLIEVLTGLGLPADIAKGNLDVNPHRSLVMVLGVTIGA